MSVMNGMSRWMSYAVHKRSSESRTSLSIADNESVPETPTKEAPKDPTHLSFHDKEQGGNVLLGLNDMRECEIFLDFTLYVEHYEIKAHKMLLTIFSPYFNSLFRYSQIQEGEFDHLTLENLKGEAVSLLIDFAYTGKVDITIDNAQDLLEAADFLGISNIKRACETLLLDNLDEENCLNLYTLGYVFTCNELCQAAIDGVLANFGTIQKSEHFNDISVPMFKEIINSEKLDIGKMTTASERQKILTGYVLEYIQWALEERIEYTCSLLSLLKLQYMDTGFLEQLLFEIPIQKSKEAREMIENVLKFRENGTELQLTDPKEKRILFQVDANELSALELNQSVKGPGFVHKGLEWNISVHLIESEMDNEDDEEVLQEFFEIIVQGASMNGKSVSVTLWAEFKLLSKVHWEENIKYRFPRKYTFSKSLSARCGSGEFVTKDEVLEQNSQFIKDGKISFEIFLFAEIPPPKTIKRVKSTPRSISIS